MFVAVAVEVAVAVAVAVGVGVLVGVAVAVGVTVLVGVTVGVEVDVGTGVGVDGEPEKSPFRFNLPPVTVRPASDAVGAAFERIAFRICSAVAFGNAEAYSAIAPVTCGVAIEVPLYDA